MAEQSHNFTMCHGPFALCKCPGITAPETGNSRYLFVVVTWKSEESLLWLWFTLLFTSTWSPGEPSYFSELNHPLCKTSLSSCHRCKSSSRNRDCLSLARTGGQPAQQRSFLSRSKWLPSSVTVLLSLRWKATMPLWVHFQYCEAEELRWHGGSVPKPHSPSAQN